MRLMKAAHAGGELDAVGNKSDQGETAPGEAHEVDAAIFSRSGIVVGINADHRYTMTVAGERSSERLGEAADSAVRGGRILAAHMTYMHSVGPLFGADEIGGIDES